MWQAKGFDSGRRDQIIHDEYAPVKRDGRSRPKQGVVIRKDRARNVETFRMEMDEVAPSFKLGPIYDSSRARTPSEGIFETKAPPTPRNRKLSGEESLQLTPIWQQIITYQKLPYNVSKSALFNEISQRLVDPEWQVRQHGLKVLQDVIPVIDPKELDDFMIDCVLPAVVSNLVHTAPAVKSSAFDVLLMYLKYSPDPEYVLRTVVFQTLESSNVPSNLQICAMNCLPTLLSQVCASENFNNNAAFVEHDSSSNTLRVPSRSGTPTARSPNRSRSPVNQSIKVDQLSQQSLLHLISVLAKKMVQIAFQHCAVACLEKIKHMIGANFFDHFLETHKPNLKRDFDVLCQVYELPNSNISDVMISPMDSLISSADDREAEVFFFEENDQQDDTDQPSSTSSFVSSSEENAKAFNQNPQSNPQVAIERNDKLESATKTEVADQNANTLDASADSRQRPSSRSDATSENDKEKIDNGEVLVETEIKLSEDTAIQMMILQERGEKENTKDESEEDDESKQLKRVTFGGELIKLRTPDSDNPTTDDDQRKKYDATQQRENDTVRSKPPSVIPLDEEMNNVTRRFVELDMDESKVETAEQKKDPKEKDQGKSRIATPQERPPSRNSPLLHDAPRRPGSSSKGGKVRKADGKVKKLRRPRSSHIPIPIKPALHRPKYRRFVLSANARRSSSKSQASSSATYDVRDSPIPNLEGGESLTSSSEGENRHRDAEQSVRSSGFLPHLGIISAETLSAVSNKDDWRQRGRGLDQLTHSLRQPDVVRFLGANDPLRTGSASLLRLLISILNERKAPLRVLTGCLKALRALCLALPVQSLVPELPYLVPATCQHIGGVSNISVKLEAVETIKMLLRKLRPSSIVNVLFTEQCYFSKSSKMRENSLLCLLYALMIFPSTEFNIPELTNVLIQCGSHEPKRKVRQALLDTFAVLGQFSPPFYVSPILDTDDSDLRFFKKAIQARLARRQLPTVSPEGLILYALQITPTSKGLDVEWVQAGSGSVSVGSADSQFSTAPFLTSDQQHSFFSGVWNDSTNDIMVTGVPPVSFHTRDVPSYAFYTHTSKPAQGTNHTTDQRFFYPAYEFPTIKGANSDPRKTKGAFEKSNGIASRGIKTWPPMQNNSKFSSSPLHSADPVSQEEQITLLNFHKNFYSNPNNSNLPVIVSSSLPDWKIPTWAENTSYYSKATNVSKWGQRDEFFQYQHYPRIEPLGKIVSNDPTSFPGNRSNGNHYNASTSIHGRTSHLPSMQQNDFMPLPNHAVNLLGDDVDFCNDDIGVKKNLSSSVPLSKSYDNLTHKNGSGENRFRYSTSLQRKQSETKSNKSSPLYPSTLQPFDSPKDALEKCLLQIESPEWEIVMQSLQGIVRLCRYHPEILVSALHRIVTSLSKQIRSLRSQVTKAACVVSQELFEQLGKTMDPEVEELAPALLSRTCDANKFLQHDANAALDSMIDNVTPIRSATFLLLKGAKHRNAVVRTTVCRLLARLCQNLSVGQVYAFPRDTRDLLLNAAAKFLLEGSLETRAYAKELFSVLAREPKFMKLMNEVVPAKTMEAIRKPLIKIVSQK